MTSGHLPAAASTWLTARFASLVHAKLMLTPSASSSVTLVNATGAALALHPSTTAGASVPVINGAVVSWIVILCSTVLLRLQASLTVYVLVMTNGQLPAAASTWLTA